MWGLASRGARLGDTRRPGRVFDVGLVRMTVRGPVEHALLDVSGELDFTYAQDLALAAHSLPHRIVSLELQGLEFLDAAGAKALHEIVETVNERWGAPPELVGASPAVIRAMELVADRDPALQR